MPHLHASDLRPFNAYRPMGSAGLATLLNVTLRRGDEFRQWSIRQREIGWDCRMMTLTAVTVFGCETVYDALSQKHHWDAEIVQARADGWA